MGRRATKASVLSVAALLAAVHSSHGFQQRPPQVHTWPSRYRSEKMRKPLTPVETPVVKSPTALSGGSLVAMAGSPLGAISVLAGIVLIHELGHYSSAKSFGIDVEEFSVGVGPKVFGFKAFGDEFNLRLLPLGGYVRFPENYNATLVEEMQAQAVEQAKAKREREKLLQQQGGSLRDKVLNVLTLGAVERKRQEQAAAAQVKTEKLPWWSRQKQNDDDNDLDVPRVEIPYDDNPNLLQNRPWQERFVVLSGGVVCVVMCRVMGMPDGTSFAKFMCSPCLSFCMCVQIFNILLAFSIYFGQINFGAGIPSPVLEPGVVVSSAPRAQAASEGLLRQGDVILDVNGRPLTQSASPSVFESQRAINDLISEIRSTPSGGDIALTVLRDSKPVDVVRIKPKPMAGANAPSIGVLLSPNFVKSEIMKTSNPVEAARLALQYTSTLTRETANGLLSVITNAFKSSGGSGVQVSGPIGLIRTGSEVVSTQDVAAIALFAAALSINLGVVNALPLPALDGGQLLFVIAEAVTGRKVDQRIQEGVTGVAVVFLLLISLGAAFGDLNNLFVGR